jgi:hypothetical protein
LRYEDRVTGEELPLDEDDDDDEPGGGIMVEGRVGWVPIHS